MSTTQGKDLPSSQWLIKMALTQLLKSSMGLNSMGKNSRLNKHGHEKTAEGVV